MTGEVRRRARVRPPSQPSPHDEAPRIKLRAPRAALDELRALVDEHLREQYAWSGGASFEALIDGLNFAGFLDAALNMLAPRVLSGAGQTTPRPRAPGRIELFDALLQIEPTTLDAVLDLVVEARAPGDCRRTAHPHDAGTAGVFLPPRRLARGAPVFDAGMARYLVVRTGLRGRDRTGWIKSRARLRDFWAE